MAHLFTPLTLREMRFKNRIFVSPMCQYSANEGMPNEWQLVHLGARAIGGAALVMTEATAVVPEGRISPQDTGLWNDVQTEAWVPIARFISANGAVPSIQLAHAGRKASTFAPWRGTGRVGPEQGGWVVDGASAAPFSATYPTPREMSVADIRAVIDAFATAAQRALRAGFQVPEIHAAHGYLLHQFLSPLVNHRSDEYGGSIENRMRFPLAVCAAVRDTWPKEWPVFLRISASDWKEGGWDVAQSIAFSREAKRIGIDLIDVSSGGAVADAQMTIGPGYQVPFAHAIREQAQMPVGAVGLITEAAQAEAILAKGEADAIFLARALLRDPHWPLHAARALDVDMEWPNQYKRAKL